MPRTAEVRSSSTQRTDPLLKIAKSNAPDDRGTVTQMSWFGQVTYIWISDNNFGRQPSFDIVYEDATNVVIEPIVTHSRP